MAQDFCYLVGKDPDTVKQELTSLLTQEIKKDYIKSSWSGNALSIKIEKAGSSELCFLVDKKDGKTAITEDKAKRKISFMHKPFIGEVERVIDDLLCRKLGAQKA